MLEAEKFPWLDKGLNGADLQEPINPDDFFEADGCRPFENWAVLENTIGGLIDEETKTTDFASLQMKVLLTDDAVGIVKADSSAFYFLSSKSIDHSQYENSVGFTFFKKPKIPCEICPRSVGWQGYNINDHTVCYVKPDERGESLLSVPNGSEFCY